jgi:hypothetical protein
MTSTGSCVLAVLLARATSNSVVSTHKRDGASSLTVSHTTKVVRFGYRSRSTISL